MRERIKKYFFHLLYNAQESDKFLDLRRHETM